MLAGLPEKAAKRAKEHKRYFDRLRKRNPPTIDKMFRELHEEVFGEIDCLSCANCCKTTGPKFLKRDMDKIAKYLSMHPKTFRLQYLHLDEDEDWVLNKLPCSFLQEDNSCLIYHVRPTACREYPHTDNRNMRSLLTITRRNTAICPAVFEIVERLMKKFPL